MFLKTQSQVTASPLGHAETLVSNKITEILKILKLLQISGTETEYLTHF